MTLRKSLLFFFLSFWFQTVLAENEQQWRLKKVFPTSKNLSVLSSLLSPHNCKITFFFERQNQTKLPTSSSLNLLSITSILLSALSSVLSTLLSALSSVLSILFSCLSLLLSCLFSLLLKRANKKITKAWKNLSTLFLV